MSNPTMLRIASKLYKTAFSSVDDFKSKVRSLKVIVNDTI